jgi:cytochrome bd-type quinol oxidase subunit 2
MNDFTQVLQPWQTFYSTIATAAATLAGLLFVSLSLNRDRLDARAKLFAQSTFANLINVLVLALIFLIPHQQASGLSIALFSFGLASFVSTLIQSFKTGGKAKLPIATTVRLVALPLVLSLTILLIAWEIYQGQKAAMFWFIGVIVLLLGSASWNVWEILFHE